MGGSHCRPNVRTDPPANSATTCTPNCNPAAPKCQHGFTIRGEIPQKCMLKAMYWTPSVKIPQPCGMPRHCQDLHAIRRNCGRVNNKVVPEYAHHFSHVFHAPDPGGFVSTCRDHVATIPGKCHVTNLPIVSCQAMICRTRRGGSPEMHDVSGMCTYIQLPTPR